MKKSKLLAMALIVVAAGTFLFTSENLFKADIAENAKIESGVYIGGIDVSGMTVEEATGAVNDYVVGLKSQSVTLVGPKANMTLTLDDMGLTADINAAVKEAVSVGKAGHLIERYMELKDLESATHVIDMRLSIDKQATAQAIYAKTDKINIKAIDNSLKREGGKFVYVPGQQGNEVDIVTAVNELNTIVGTEWEVSFTDKTEFTLASIVSEPRGSEEELAKIKDVLGTFATDYSFSAEGRAQNVETGVSKINGTMLYPGEEFSVYETTSPFTAENGYELAGSYLDGETVQSYGGGICQVTTTLYNAALLSEMEIKERFNHSMTVSYGILSADAAISGTAKDMKFVNPYDYPIYIEGYCSGGHLTFTIYGCETRPSNRKIEFISETLSTNDPDTEYSFSEGIALGGYEQPKSEHVGYTAKLWKIVTIDGVQTEKIQVNYSSYRASAGKLIIGTGGATSDQLEILNAAVATKDDLHVLNTVAMLGATTTPEGDLPTEGDEPTQGETTPEGDATTPPTDGEGTGTSGNR